MVATGLAKLYVGTAAFGCPAKRGKALPAIG
jgi:hypothetical protein